jgi:hypothetical protein
VRWDVGRKTWWCGVAGVDGWIGMRGAMTRGWCCSYSSYLDDV